MFFKIGVLKKLRIFHKKISVLESLLNKVVHLRTCNVIKKKLQHRFFPVKFSKLLRTPCFTEHLQWLLLEGYHFMTGYRQLKDLMKLASYLKTCFIKSQTIENHPERTYFPNFVLKISLYFQLTFFNECFNKISAFVFTITCFKPSLVVSCYKLAEMRQLGTRNSNQ